MTNRIVALWVCAVVLLACAKKEETAQQGTPDPALVSSAQGTYAAELPAADTPGRAFTLSLNADNTASMSVDYKNGEPAVVQSGSWTVEPTSNNVQVTLTREPAGTGQPEIMSFAMTADTLALTNWMDLNYGEGGLRLVRTSPGSGTP